MMRLLHRMKLAHKFLILGVVFLVMVAVPMGLYFKGPLVALHKVIQFSQTHRGMSASMRYRPACSGKLALPPSPARA